MMCKHRPSSLPRRLWGLLLATSILGSATVQAETRTFTLTAPDYQIFTTVAGQEIEMAGFGQLAEPGKPLLPTRKFLLAFPPGAEVRSARVEGLDPVDLQGRYDIAAAPPILPLLASDRSGDLVAGALREWQGNRTALHDSDQMYPATSGKLEGTGTLRKYSYVAVSFFPFRYHPRSGRLVYSSAARVTVDFTVPPADTPAARRIERLKNDRVSDERARRLFVNYEDVRHAYEPVMLNPGGKTALPKVYDYVIITTEALAAAVNASDFVGWKMKTLGYGVRIVHVTDPDITSQPGVDLAERIRNFLRGVYISWGIEYVLLVGDYSTVPMRYCYPNPANHTNDAGNPNAYSGEVPTDFYYADLSQPDALSWDLDGDGYHGEYGQDSPDLVADVCVGRIPTSDPARVTYTLNKITTFEQDKGLWKKQALHAAAIAYFENENYSGYEFKDLATYIDLVETDFMDFWVVSHYSEQDGLVHSAYPWQPLSTTAFLDDWRAGQYAVVNWGGHGWSDGAYGKVWNWDDGDGVAESPEMSHYPFVNLISNLDDDHPSIVFALSCLVGYPEPNAAGNLGIDLLTDPALGAAVGIVSGARVVWVSRGGGELLCYEFNHYLIDGPGGTEKLGDALYDSKLHVNQNYSWNHFAEYWNMFTFNLYGDPSLVREGALPPTAVPSLAGSLPAVRLGQNHPNPFNPATTIGFELSRSGHVKLTVFGIDGRRVATLVDGTLPAGIHRVTWRGQDEEGAPVASGVYFYQLEAAGSSEIKGMVLVR